MNNVIVNMMTLEEANRTNVLIKGQAATLRHLLLEMRDKQGWKQLGYESFQDYGEQQLGYGKVYLYRLANAAEVEKSLELPIGNSVGESQLRPLSNADEKDRQAIWDEATKAAEEAGKKLTAKNVQDAVKDWKKKHNALQLDLTQEQKKRESIEQTINEQVDNRLKDKITIFQSDEKLLRDEIDSANDSLSKLRFRLKRDVEEGVKAGLAEQQTEINQKQFQIQDLDKRINELNESRNELSREYALVREHQTAIKECNLSLEKIAIQIHNVSMDGDQIPEGLYPEWEKVLKNYSDGLRALNTVMGVGLIEEAAQ